MQPLISTICIIVAKTPGAWPSFVFSRDTLPCTTAFLRYNYLKLTTLFLMTETVHDITEH